MNTTKNFESDTEFFIVRESSFYEPHTETQRHKGVIFCNLVTLWLFKKLVVF